MSRDLISPDDTNVAARHRFKTHSAPIDGTVQNQGPAIDPSALVGPVDQATTSISLVLLVFTLMLILGVGLAPFHWVQRATEFTWTAAASAGAADAIANTYLFVPLGFFAFLVFRSRMGGAAALGLASGAAVLLSLAMEGMQTHLPLRVPSIIDIVANSTGGVAGAAIAAVVRSTIVGFIRQAIVNFQDSPRSVLALCVASLILIVGLSPFAVALDAKSVGSRLRNSHVVPFESHYADITARNSALRNGRTRDAQFIEWRALKRWGGWCVEFAAYFIFAALLLRAAKTEFGFTRGGAAMMALWASLGLAVIQCALQLLAITRGVDVTDVLFRAAGAALAILLGGRRFLHRPISFPMAAKASAVFCGAYWMYNSLLPLHFDASSVNPARAEIIPFLAMLHTRFDLLAADIMETAFLAGGLAAALTALLEPVRNRRRRSLQGESLCRSPENFALQTAYTDAGTTPVAAFRPQHFLAGRLAPILWCVALAAGLEGLQFFLPVRTPSITDVIVAGLGAWIGIVVSLKIQGLIAVARQIRTSVTPSAIDPIAAAQQSMDDAFSSLSDPAIRSPSESIPKERHR